MTIFARLAIGRPQFPQETLHRRHRHRPTRTGENRGTLFWPGISPIERAADERHRRYGLHYRLPAVRHLGRQEAERKSESPWKQSTEISSLKRERLGGFGRAKEEFNGVDVVVSYLINKGDNYENHDNSTSNCVDFPEYVRPCPRWDEHGKSRQSPLQHGRCGRSYCNQTQECFWEYASSHRA